MKHIQINNRYSLLCLAVKTRCSPEKGGNGGCYEFVRSAENNSSKTNISWDQIKPLTLDSGFK